MEIFLLVIALSTGLKFKLDRVSLWMMILLAVSFFELALSSLMEINNICESFFNLWAGHINGVILGVNGGVFLLTVAMVYFFSKYLYQRTLQNKG